MHDFPQNLPCSWNQPHSHRDRACVVTKLQSLTQDLSIFVASCFVSPLPWMVIQNYLGVSNETMNCNELLCIYIYNQFKIWTVMNYIDYIKSICIPIGFSHLLGSSCVSSYSTPCQAPRQVAVDDGVFDAGAVGVVSFISIVPKAVADRVPLAQASLLSLKCLQGNLRGAYRCHFA